MRQLTLVEPHRLEWADVDDPERQDARDALVRPLAVATCDLDAPIIAGRTPYEPPIAVGHECVAEVVEAPDGGPEQGTLVSVPFQISCGECVRCRRGLTGNCESVPFLSMYGFGSFGGDWGGFLSGIVRVPFSDHMLSPLPDGVSAEGAASVSDNIVDGWRLVAPGLEQWPGGEVLVAGGSPSIGLYGVQVALALGAARVVYCDVEGERLRKAEGLGAEVIDGYPERLGPFPITAMVATEPAALALAARSTSTRTSSRTPATQTTSAPAWPPAHLPACSSPPQPPPAPRCSSSDSRRNRTHGRGCALPNNSGLRGWPRAGSGLSPSSVWLLVLVTGALELGLECVPETGAGEEIAVWALESVLDQRLRLLRVGDASVELRDLALGQVTPASTSLAAGGEHAADLREREAGVLVEVDQCDPLCARRRVVPFPAGTLGGWQQADALVPAQRRCRRAGAASQLSDRH